MSFKGTSLRHKCVIWLLRLLLPPHVDNEEAAVRPDSLIDEMGMTDYEEHASPICDAKFDAGSTSRINVAHFMPKLITDHGKWNKWRGHVIDQNAIEGSSGDEFGSSGQFRLTRVHTM